MTNGDICTELSGAKNQLVTMIPDRVWFCELNFLKRQLCHLFKFVSTNQLLAVIEISACVARGACAKKHIDNHVSSSEYSGLDK